MSINSSLVKLADKIDADGKSSVSPDYKNPNNSIEKSIERIADNYSSSGGGGALIATLNLQTGALDKTWTEINNADIAFVSITESGLNVRGFVAMTAPSDNGYMVGAISYSDTETGIGMLRFTTDSADGYPVMQM